MKGHPEIGETHGFTQRFCLVGHRAGHVFVGLRNRQPREVFPNTFCVILEFKRFVVHRSQKGVFGVVEGVVVVDEVTRFQALELILHCFTMPRIGYDRPSWGCGITLGQ